MKDIDGCSTLPIVTLFYIPDENSITTKYYREVMVNTLKQILPDGFFELDLNDQEAIEERKKFFRTSLPHISMSETQVFPGNISFFAISKYRSSSFKFFFEMISRWLTPGKRLNVVLVYASDFSLSYQSEEIYTLCEVIIRVESKEQYAEIKRNYPTIQSEIVLGIDSAFYAQRILDVKGLSADEKTATIHENIAFLVKRLPSLYSYDVFTEMQHMLLISSDDFKQHRSARQLSRIISFHYLFRRSILNSIKSVPQHRHVSLKIFRAFIQGKSGPKQVLGVVVVMNFLADREAFGEKQLLKTIQHHVKGIKEVDNSFILNRTESAHIQTLYLEIEKVDGSAITSEEIQKLRKDLPADLKNRVEQRHHPVFMPRNEEEIMRNIIILCDQLRYVRDIPQLQISFDHQSHSDINFTILIARILKPGDLSIANLIKKADLKLEYYPDRVKEMGMLRKKYVKEATVFRLKLPKEKFLRDDQSIDLYKARQSVVNDLAHALGEIRDYNGGMISKQHEVLSQIRNMLTARGHFDELLMEDFFFSFTPDVVRALMDPKDFVTLFTMLMQGIRDYNQKGYYLQAYDETYNVFVVVISDEMKVCDRIHEAIEAMNINTAEIASSRVKVNGNFCIGFLNCIRESNRKTLFYDTIKGILDSHYSEFVNQPVR